MTITSTAADAAQQKNPFNLVYDGAITKNEPAKVNIHPVNRPGASQASLSGYANSM